MDGFTREKKHVPDIRENGCDRYHITQQEMLNNYFYLT